MAEQHKQTPDWLLERMAQNEAIANAEGSLSPEHRELLRRSDEEILAAYPVAQMAHEIRRRHERAPLKKERRSWTLALVPAMVAVALAVVVGRDLLEAPPENKITIEEEPEITRPKGLSPRLQLYRKRGEQVERLQPNAKAREHDVLQLSYISAGKRYGVIVSVDGRGVVTRHLPEDGQLAASLSAEGEVALPNAYELDDAPRFECFYLITADQPFPAETVISASKTLTPESMGKPLPLPGGLAQSWILIQKEPR